MSIGRIGENRDLRTNLLLRYRFQDTTGTTQDSSPTPFNGTVIGATRSTSGFIFNGSSDEVINTASGLLTPLTDTSVLTLIVRTEASLFENANTAISLGENNSNDALALYTHRATGGNGAAIWYDGEFIIEGAGSAPADGTYSDYAFVQDGATINQLYVNGVLAGLNFDSKATSVNMDGLSVGRYLDNGEYYTGGIKEVLVYNRALTAQQIAYYSTLH